MDKNKTFKILDFEIVEIVDEENHYYEKEYKIYVELSDGRKGYGNSLLSRTLLPHEPTSNSLALVIFKIIN